MPSATLPVVIVGAGPVGLTLANLLGVRGIQTLVLERNSETVRETRAVALDDEALRIFSATGLIDRLVPDMRLGAHAIYYNAAGRTLFELAPTQFKLGFPLISFFLQPRLEASLVEGTKRFEHVQVRFHHTVDRITQSDGSVLVEGEDAEHRRFSIQARYLIGCDGGRSAVRSQLGVKLVGSTYKERWLVLDTAGYTSPSHLVTFYCDPRRPTVSVPMPHGHHRWEFLLHGHETDAEMLTEAKGDEMLRPYLDPRSIQIHRKVVYPFHARQAERFRVGNVLLAGDAAHLMPPFAGQGMCSGLRDAHNLAWKLAAVLQGQAPETLLDTYEAERAPHAREMTKVSMMLGQIVMARSRAVAFARDTLFRILSHSPESMLFLREFRFKPPPQIRAGLLWRHMERGPMTGLMIPQPRVRTASGREVLLDQVLGPDFSLVGLNMDPAFAMPPELVARWKRLVPRHVSLVQPSRNPLREDEVSDLNGLFSAQGGGERASGLCLVRPDRFIAAHFQPEHASLVADFLARARRES